MEMSKYLEQFGVASKHFKLFGSKILVEQLEVGEIKSKGGLILSAPAHAKSTLKKQEPMVCVVLAVGEGYTNDDGASIPLTVKPGNIVVTNLNGVLFFSTLPGVPSYSEMKVGITTESDVQMLFESIEEFNAYVSVFMAEPSQSQQLPLPGLLTQ